MQQCMTHFVERNSLVIKQRLKISIMQKYSFAYFVVMQDNPSINELRIL